MSIRVGLVVTVILEDCIVFEEQGEVVGIEDDGDPEGPIEVQFKCSSYLSHVDDGVLRFHESDLRVDDGWTPKNEALILFGRYNWHALLTFTDEYPWSGKNLCQHEGCPRAAVQRCMINTWGTVSQVDLCLEHKEEWHGVCTESFPFKKPEAS